MKKMFVPKSSLLNARQRQDLEKRHGDELGPDWKTDHPELEIVEVVVPELCTVDEAPTAHGRRAVVELTDFMNDLFGRTWSPTFGPGRSGSMMAARYQEVRGEGKTHEEAIEVCKSVVKWIYRNWWTSPAMRPYCKPDSIFRKTKFHERRTTL